MAPPELLITHLSYHARQKRILEQINLCLGGGIFGLLGANGAGKSTLLKLMATVVRPTSGEIRVDQWQRPGDDRQIRRMLGYVPQQYGLVEHLTLQEFLDYSAVMKGVTQTQQAIQQVSAWMGLDAWLHTRIANVSGGTKQRVVIAQALLNTPSLLILDEPTAGLDPNERVQLKNLLQQWASTTTIILSTHIVSDIEGLADTVGILDHGQLLAQGSIPAIIHKADGLVYQRDFALSDWHQVADDWMARSRPAQPMERVVVRITSTSQTVTIRYLTQTPDEEGTLVSPHLEDGYLALVHFPERRNRHAAIAE
ncbi:MAG: ATP-binding cassette domain-containing protein [Sulfobacillus thermotolerans]|nr:ATP-binding cassette domain-containing protein [Sulfobacillus thermotolerans]